MLTLLGKYRRSYSLEIPSIPWADKPYRFRTFHILSTSTAALCCGLVALPVDKSRIIEPLLVESYLATV